MSLYGVIAGIHGNREALRACLEKLDGKRVRRIVCLGGIVGYNADPDECVALVRARCAATVAGAWDLIAAGRRGFDECSPEEEYALRRTRRELGAAGRAWLAALPQSAELEDLAFSAQRLAFPGGSLEDIPLVDGSRKRGARLAECALVDTLGRSVEIVRVPYDSAASEAKAAVFGYRINALTESFYALRRRTASAARRIGARLRVHAD